MELLKNLLFILAAIAFILVLIAIAWKLLNVKPYQMEYYFKGEKDKVVSAIVDLIYKCYDENKDGKKAVICFQARLETTEAINSSEITGKINPSKIDPEKVRVPDMIQNNTIIIRYEDKFVYIETLEGERVGS
jgi:predicted membrane protein